MDVKSELQTKERDAAPWLPGSEYASPLTGEPYAAILDSLPLGVFVLTAHGSPFYCNRAGVDILGRGIAPDSRLETLAADYQTYRVATGQLYPSDALPIVRALNGEACTVSDVELRHKTPPVVLKVWAAPLRDSAGKIQFAMATFVEAEPEGDHQSKVPAQNVGELHQSQMEVIGELAAGVAHEINTPMQYIGDNTAFLGVTVKRLLELAASFERLLSECRGGGLPEHALESCARDLQKARIEFLREQAPSAVEQSLAGIDQVRSIIQALKEFSHPGDEQRVTMDINHLVKMSTTVTRNTWRYIAELTLDLDADLRQISGYPQEIGQVLINLIVNACHAIEERESAAALGRPGKITIRTAARENDIEIQIEDNGAGIPDAIRDRIMSPFFTTKPAGKGTGQGLALATKVISDRHAGKLGFESRVGKGTKFFIHLPGPSDG